MEETEEKKTYTEEELEAKVKEAMFKQLNADELRTHGNAFYAEALDHIAVLAQKDKFWAKVFEYGKAFRNDFEIMTNQIPRPQAAPPKKGDKKAKEKEKEGEPEKPENS